MTKNADKAKKAFEFLRERERTNQPFSAHELAVHVGNWKDVTARTYMSKQWKDLLSKSGEKYIVRPEFRRTSEEQFVNNFTQKRPIYTEYARKKHENVITYEFLLPLTKEDKLRRALDDLFYEDTILSRIDEIGLSNMEKIIPRIASESDAKYRERVLKKAERFGGYSISHVHGRFRAGQLQSRKQAGDILATNGRYLIDETTAVVKFIVPCQTGSREFGKEFDEVNCSLSCEATNAEDKLADEQKEIRALFFHLFVEAVVRTIRGEDEIWLIETGSKQRVFVWSRVGA